MQSPQQIHEIHRVIAAAHLLDSSIAGLALRLSIRRNQLARSKFDTCVSGTPFGGSQVSGTRREHTHDRPIQTSSRQ